MTLLADALIVVGGAFMMLGAGMLVAAWLLGVP